ncbi:Protein SQS1 [Mycena sanguinolenta]|uniref:Protein SQS1 n=1 Tax=Mycena sanguinolenta TaxID=230812 RepID=A0A8H6ZDA5_9AGAR|nr:Protein SQS1 [Mycena sanguinolenta]
MYPEQQQTPAIRGGYGWPGNRGRGIGSPVRGYDSPPRGRGRGRGSDSFDSPRGRGRGRGGPKLGPDAPLSKLLDNERPLLRPIKFVPSMYHATLFEEEEELFQPIVEDVDDSEQSHVPTAERVARVFSGGNIPRIESENEDTLEEVDFEDMSKLRKEVDAAALLPQAQADASSSNLELWSLPLHPLRARSYSDDEEEVIVYDAPNPRAGRSRIPSPAPAPDVEPSTTTGTSDPSVAAAAPATLESTAPPPELPAFASVSFAAPTPSPKKVRRQAPVFTPHARMKVQAKARGLAKRVARRAASSFSAFGARAEEARLHDRDDPRRDEQRRGDSDVDWGDSDDDETELHNGDEDVDGGMDVDVELDARAMARFARGMGPEGGRFVTMDDIWDEQRMREEDEEVAVRGPDTGSSAESEEEEEADESEGDEEADAIVDTEEALMIAEPGDLSEEEDEDDEEDSDDNERSPKTAFQSRLERLRKAAQERGADDSLEIMELSDDDDDYESRRFWMITVTYCPRIRGKAEKRLLKAVANGELDIDDFDDFIPAKRGKNKRNGLPPELQDVWDRDRAKKAENKRLRALARAAAAADPMAHKKGGKKGRKAMLAAARLDSTITVLPNRIIDMTTLEQQIRRFIGAIGGPPSMSLPPADKETRKKVHEMALAFGLKSQSKGKGEARYTTLIKTSRSGIMIDEKKVAKILKRGAGGWGGGARGKGRGAAMPRQRDGDEVGKAAPKIGEGNIGFKMLALMGWAEGDRIGASADGLHVPLTAVIKNTKLGLGATR